MATTFKWLGAEVATTTHSTSLNSLADGSFAGASSAITNSSDLFEFMDVELVLGSLSPAAGAFVDVWIYYSIDATNFADAAKPLQTSALLCTFQLDTTAATAQRLFNRLIPIAPHDFKLDVRNKAGVALNASGNTLKISRYDEQGV